MQDVVRGECAEFTTDSLSSNEFGVCDRDPEVLYINETLSDKLGGKIAVNSMVGLELEITNANLYVYQRVYRQVEITNTPIMVKTSDFSNIINVLGYDTGPYNIKISEVILEDDLQRNP